MRFERTCAVILLISLTDAFAENVTQTCIQLYENGVDAYLENRFEDCVRLFEGATERYHLYFKKTQHCRLKCHEESALSEPLYPISIDDLHFYERTIKNTLCILNCKDSDKDTFKEFNLNKETVKLFEDLKPYEYLHVCYYHMKFPTKAASAAFTYLVGHPNDQSMLKILKSYATLPDVDMADVINYEAKDYVYLYVHGAQAYEDKNWATVIDNMEESLTSYLQAEDECRADCEGPFNQGWYPDLIPSIANHFTYCLRCKQKCKTELSTLNGERHDDLYPSHYHYLQFAYFKSGNIKAACEAVASYLIFYPLDEVMIYNREYYKKLPKVEAEFFVPRPEAMHYFHRDTYEDKLLKFIFKKFTNIKPEPKKVFESPFDTSENNFI